MNDITERAVRSALRHLGDVVYLTQSPLAELMAARTGWRPDGYTLQYMLCQAIKDLCPPEELAYLARQRTRHCILRLRYLEGWDIVDIAQYLAMSERQYYRELKAGIWLVADRVLGNAR